MSWPAWEHEITHYTMLSQCQGQHENTHYTMLSQCQGQHENMRWHTIPCCLNVTASMSTWDHTHWHAVSMRSHYTCCLNVMASMRTCDHTLYHAVSMSRPAWEHEITHYTMLSQCHGQHEYMRSHTGMMSQCQHASYKSWSPLYKSTAKTSMLNTTQQRLAPKHSPLWYHPTTWHFLNRYKTQRNNEPSSLGHFLLLSQEHRMGIEKIQQKTI